jgi:hypothetical protein
MTQTLAAAGSSSSSPLWTSPVKLERKSSKAGSRVSKASKSFIKSPRLERELVDSQSAGRPWSAGTNGSAWKLMLEDDPASASTTEERSAATVRGVQTIVIVTPSWNSRRRRRARARKPARWPCAGRGNSTT